MYQAWELLDSIRAEPLLGDPLLVAVIDTGIQLDHIDFTCQGQG